VIERHHSYKGEQDKDIRRLWHRGEHGAIVVHRELVKLYGPRAVSLPTVSRRLRELNAAQRQLRLQQEQMRQQFIKEEFTRIKHELTAHPDRAKYYPGVVLEMLELV
jgi:hypothetical protein